MLHSPLRSALLLLLGAGVAGCDSSARSQTGAPQIVGSSGELESCTSHGDCGEGLACYELVCRREARSRMGEFHAALGRYALEQGDIQGAVGAYVEAVNEYGREKLPLPVELICEQGQALARARETPRMAEGAARGLHACVLRAPLGSALSRRALDTLATLTESGLEPSLIGRDKAADLYMTAEPTTQKLEGVKVSVEPEGKNRKRTFASLGEAMQSESAKAAMTACFESYWKETEAEQLSVTLPFSYRYILHPEEASLDRVVLELEEGSPPAEAAAAKAHACVRQVAEGVAGEAVKSMRDDTRWKSALKVTIGV